MYIVAHPIPCRQGSPRPFRMLRKCKKIIKYFSLPRATSHYKHDQALVFALSVTWATAKIRQTPAELHFAQPAHPQTLLGQILQLIQRQVFEPIDNLCCSVGDFVHLEEIEGPLGSAEQRLGISWQGEPIYCQFEIVMATSEADTADCRD